MMIEVVLLLLLGCSFGILNACIDSIWSLISLTAADAAARLFLLLLGTVDAGV